MTDKILVFINRTTGEVDAYFCESFTNEYGVKGYRFTNGITAFPSKEPEYCACEFFDGETMLDVMIYHDVYEDDSPTVQRLAKKNETNGKYHPEVFAK